MPSSVNPSVIQSGPGKIHVDVVSAASDIFSGGSSAILSSVAAVISQPLAKPTFVTFTAGGSGDATRSLTSGAGPYFVGSSNLSDLFRIVNAADDTEIFNRITGLYVSVASINVAQSGFANSLILTFNTPVPASVQYKVYYGLRVTVASLPADLASDPVIRRSLDRVRFPEFNRTGFAPTSISAAANYTSSDVPDPYLAHWKATLTGNNVTAYSNSRGGAMGYVHLGTVPNVLDGTGNDAFQENLAGAAFFSAFKKDIKATSFATSPSSTPYTKIDSSVTATITAPNTVTLEAGDYFRTLAGFSSSFRLGVDMLEITYTSGAFSGRKVVVVPTAFSGGNNRVATCHTLGGDTASLTTASANVRWIRPNFFVGGGHGKQTSEFDFLGMGVLSPGCITTEPDEEVEHVPPFFSSGTLDPARAGVNEWNIKAFTWGSFNETTSTITGLGAKAVKGELRGDGSLLSLGGHVEGLITSRAQSTIAVSSTSSVSWNPFDGSLLRIQLTGTSTKVLTLTLDAEYLADQKDGDQITLFLHFTSGSSGNLLSTVVWPSQFIFSGRDFDVRTTRSVDTFSVPAVPILKYTGISLAGFFYMTRTDYEDL